MKRQIDEPQAPLRGRSSLFGEFVLVPHPGEDDPGETLVGYVSLEGDETLHHAVRVNNAWHGARKRPFTKRIVSWYSFARPDGRPLFCGLHV
jgi:hypothetical protein